MSDYTYQHFNVTFPPERQYVAHVEINRPDKMNAFFERYHPPSPSPTPFLLPKTKM